MWRGRVGDAEQGRRAWNFLSALAAERGRRDKQDQSDPMCTASCSAGASVTANQGSSYVRHETRLAYAIGLLM